MVIEFAAGLSAIVAVTLGGLLLWTTAKLRETLLGRAKDGVATVDKMKAMEVDDDCFGKTKIREDGRNLVPAYLFEVKKPAESKGPWDYYKLVATTPGNEAFRPLAEGHCSFVKA